MAYNEGYNVGWDIAGPQQEQLEFEATPTGQTTGGGGGFNLGGLGGILDLFNKSNNTSGGTTGKPNSGLGSTIGGSGGGSGGMMGGGSASGLGGILSKVMGMMGGGGQPAQPAMAAGKTRNTGSTTPSDLWSYDRGSSNNMDLGTMLALMQMGRGGGM